MKKIYKKYELDKSVKNSPNCQHIHTIAANSLLYSTASVRQIKLQKTLFNFAENTNSHCGANREKGRRC